MSPMDPHPEAFCSRCERPNAPTWHAPSPLWNAVMRDPATGIDAFSIVCPPCFAELAAAKGFDYAWHFGPHEDVTALWADRDGRVWDADSCLWSEAALDPDPLHVDEDEDHRVSRWDHHSRPPRRDGVPGPAIVLAIVGIPLLVLIVVAIIWFAE